MLTHLYGMALGVKLWQNSGRTVVEAALRPPCGRFIRPGLIILKLGTNDLSRLDPLVVVLS